MDRSSPLLVQVKVLDGEREQRSREVAELQTRLSVEEQREEERTRDLFSLKQRLTEAETAKTSIKKEVRRRRSRPLIDFHCAGFCLRAALTH